MLKFFGPHIVAAEGDEWKRFRKLVGPAFSEVSLESMSSDRRFSSFSVPSAQQQAGLGGDNTCGGRFVRKGLG